jgi:hypothetical protein
MKFFRGLLFGTLLSVPVWALIIWFTVARSDVPAAATHKLAGWVHMTGCPHSSKSIGQHFVVLWFDDGESVQIDINKLTDEKREDLKAFIGDVQGYTFVAKCEMAT